MLISTVYCASGPLAVGRGDHAEMLASTLPGLELLGGLDGFFTCGFVSRKTTKNVLCRDFCDVF